MTEPDTNPTPPAALTAPPRRYFLREQGDSLFTGAKLADIDPVRHSFILELLAEGILSRRQIARAAGVSPNTIRAIDDSRAGSIDALRERLKETAASIESATLERIREILDDPNHKPTHKDLKELAAILREVGTRSDLMAGRPTAIIGREPGSVTDLAEASAARRAILRKINADAIPADFTESPAPGTHFRTETAPTRATGAQDPQPLDAQADPSTEPTK